VAYNLANYNVILGTNSIDYIGHTKDLPKNDYIKAGDGTDYVYAHAGNDVVHGGWGADSISAGAGNDQIYGDAGNDILRGDAGADRFHFTAGNGNDKVLDFNRWENDTWVLYGVDPARVYLEDTGSSTTVHLNGNKDTILFLTIEPDALLQGFGGFQTASAYDWGGVVI